MIFPEQYRQQGPWPYVSKPGSPYGYFEIPAHKNPGRRPLKVIAINADGADQAGQWEHVSVSIQGAKNKTPSWEEMCFIKDLFWEPEAWVLQFHPAKSDYINCHPCVLHLWRPVAEPIPKPPKVCV